MASVVLPLNMHLIPAVRWLDTRIYLCMTLCWSLHDRAGRCCFHGLLPAAVRRIRAGSAAFPWLHGSLSPSSIFLEEQRAGFGVQEGHKEGREERVQSSQPVCFKSLRSRLHPSAWLDQLGTGRKGSWAPHVVLQALTLIWRLWYSVSLWNWEHLSCKWCWSSLCRAGGFICEQFVSHRSWGKESNNWSLVPI